MPSDLEQSAMREVAWRGHAMSTAYDGRSDGHGPVFMGLYVRLLVRYLRLDETCLLASLREAGVSIARDARPVFLDPQR